MLFEIQQKSGANLIVEKSGDVRSNAYTIKMACDEEMRTNGKVDLNNLAESLKRNDFKIHQIVRIKIQ